MPKLLASELAREHGQELLRLEQDELQRLRRTYEQARKEILAKLAETPADTFTAQQLRSVQLQIESGIRSMTKALAGSAERQMDALLEQGIAQTVAEIAYWEPKFRGGGTQRIRAAAARRVLKPRALLLQQYQVSINAYGLSLIGDTQRRLGVHLVKNSSWREMSLDIAGRLETNAIQGARWRAERIIRTEMVDVLNLGHYTALEETESLLPGLAGQWDSTLDKRTSQICLELNGRIRRIGEPFTIYRGRPIMRPPAIPNCRSRVIPWHADWANLDQTIEPEKAPKPVTREHQPGPKPVTKTEAKEGLWKSHEAVVKAVASGAPPTAVQIEALTATARTLFRMEGLSGKNLEAAVAKRLEGALKEGQKKFQPVKMKAAKELQAVEKKWTDAYIEEGGQAGFIPRKLEDEFYNAAAYLGKLEGATDIEAYTNARLVTVAKQAKEAHEVQLAAAKAQAIEARAAFIEAHKLPSKPDPKDLVKALAQWAKLQGKKGADSNLWQNELFSAAKKAGVKARVEAVELLEAQVGKAKAIYQKVIEESLDWNDDIGAARIVLQQKLKAVADLAGDVEGDVNTWIAGELQATENLGKAGVAAKVKQLGDEYVAGIVAGKATPEMAEQYGFLRTWLERLAGENNPTQLAAQALLDLQGQGAQQIKKAAIQAEAKNLYWDNLTIHAEGATVSAKEVAALKILKADAEVIAQIAKEADTATDAAEILSTAKAIAEKKISTFRTGMVDSLISENMKPDLAKLLWKELDETLDAVGYTKAKKAALWDQIYADAEKKVGAKPILEGAGEVAPGGPPAPKLPPALKPYPKTQSGAPTEIALPSGKKATRLQDSPGSNPGGFYRTADGEEWFVKFPPSTGQVGAEQVSADLARQMGLKTKDYQAFMPDDAHVAIASPKIDFEQLSGSQMAGWKNREELAEHFVHAAWTCNWDIAGLGFDNLVATQSGDLMVIDYGRSLLWRAQGALKKDGLPKIVSELNTLRDGSNAQTAKAFGSLTDQDIAKAVKAKLSDLDDDEIIAAVARGNFAAEDAAAIQQGLLERKAWLDDWADEVLGVGGKGGPDEVKKALLGHLPNDPDAGIAWKAGTSVDAKERYRKALGGDVESLVKLGRRLWAGTPQMEQNQELALRFLQTAWQYDKAAVKTELGQWTQTMTDVLGALEVKGEGQLSVKVVQKEIQRQAKLRAAKQAREAAEAAKKAAKAKAKWEAKKAEFAGKKAVYDAEVADWEKKKTAFDEAVKEALGKRKTTTGLLTKAYEKKVDTWTQKLLKPSTSASQKDYEAFLKAKSKFDEAIEGQAAWFEKVAEYRQIAAMKRAGGDTWTADYYEKRAKKLENKTKRILAKAKAAYGDEIEPLAAKANLFRVKAESPGARPEPPEGLFEAAIPKLNYLKEQPSRSEWVEMAQVAARRAAVDYNDAYEMMRRYSNGDYRHLRQAMKGRTYDGKPYTTPDALRDKTRMENLAAMIREMPGYESPGTSPNRMFTTHKESFRSDADRTNFVKMLDHAVESGEPFPPWGAITSGSSHGHWSGNLHYHIYGRITGTPINPVSSNSGEMEVFLLPEMRVNVRKWYRQGSDIIVECEEYH